MAGLSGYQTKQNPAVLLPHAWADPTVAFDARGYGDVEVQFVGAPGTNYTAARSLDGTNFAACGAINSGDLTVVTSVSAAGIYIFPGGGYLKFSAGAGSTLTRRAS